MSLNLFKQNGFKPLYSITKKFIFLWYHVKQNGSKPYTTIWLYYMTLWYHAKQNGSKTYINPHCSILPLWYHVKQNDSKPEQWYDNPLVPLFIMFNMAEEVRDRRGGVAKE